MKTIFDRISLNNLNAKNRIVRSATWEAISNFDGSPSKEQIEICEELAKGGVGTIVTGFTTILGDDHYIERMSRLSNDKLIAEWRKLTEIAHKENCKVITQLALGEYILNGKILSQNDCKKVELEYLADMFGKAAKRAKEAGFDGIQIHGAHNFWLSRFISPAFNHRSDNYGGDQKSRTRLLVEIYEAIKKNAADLHITMKINCSDFLDSGLSMDDAMDTCLIMANKGIDSIEISGNGTSVSNIRAGVNEAYYLPFAKELKNHSQVPIILVGGHRSIENMNNILNSTSIEMFSISRPLIREPGLINRWQSGDSEPAKCISCNMCYQTPGHRCIFVLRDNEKNKRKVR